MSAREFRERYNRLTSLAGPLPAPPVSLTSSTLPSDARTVSTSSGDVVTFTQTFTSQPVAEALDLLNALPDVQPEEMVFLDTETTGLAGGTGTYAFLVGLGRFSGSQFIVDQYFMKSPADESAMLDALKQDLGLAQRLVTYNGRTFDVPLLESRFRLVHQSIPLDFEHLDLLHTTRAIWKHRLASCSLSNIESNVLGVEREVDAPGWLIPTIYFEYLKSKRPERLIPVIEHNRVDILSLARLTALVLSYEYGLLEPVNSIDRTALALYKLKKFGLGSGVSALWADRRAPADLRRQFLVELSRQHKRQNKYQVMVEGWEAGTKDPSRAIREYCAVELAKFYEHQEQDYNGALQHSKMALDSSRLARDHKSEQLHLHRVRRLEKKLDKMAIQS